MNPITSRAEPATENRLMRNLIATTNGSFFGSDFFLNMGITRPQKKQSFSKWHLFWENDDRAEMARLLAENDHIFLQWKRDAITRPYIWFLLASTTL